MKHIDKDAHLTARLRTFSCQLDDANVHFRMVWVARVCSAQRLCGFQVLVYTRDEILSATPRLGIPTLPYRHIKRRHVRVHSRLAKLAQRPKKLARPLQRIIHRDEFQPFRIVILYQRWFESLVFVLFRPHYEPKRDMGCMETDKTRPKFTLLCARVVHLLCGLRSRFARRLFCLVECLFGQFARGFCQARSVKKKAGAGDRKPYPADVTI